MTSNDANVAAALQTVQHQLEHLNVYLNQKAPDFEAPRPAPHKPLLLLVAIDRAQRGEPRMMTFDEAESALSPLLGQFAYGQGPHHAEYPFVRLQHDAGGQLWDLAGLAAGSVNVSGDVAPSVLRDQQVTAGPTAAVYELMQQPATAAAIARCLLRRWFDPTARLAVAQAVGLDELIFQ